MRDRKGERERETKKKRSNTREEKIIYYRFFFYIMGINLEKQNLPRRNSTSVKPMSIKNTEFINVNFPIKDNSRSRCLHH